MRDAQQSICVIGGGFTGIATALACLTELKQPFRLVLVEPKSSLGLGVAFGAQHPLHLLNVRTRDLSVRAGQPGDFLNWAYHQLDQGENHEELHESLAHTFLPRQLFGEYVRQRFFEAVQDRRDVALRIVNEAATSCSAEDGRFRVGFATAQSLVADVVFVATAYGLRESPPSGAVLPYDAALSDELVAAKTMALLGTGPTMVDALLAARRNGFQGKAIAISRRGQLPRSHAPKGVVPLNVELPNFKKVSALTQTVRIACEFAQAEGTPWQAVFNGLRPSLQSLWQDLSLDEQRRFLRHVRPFWDAHRHRLPIEIHARLAEELKAGTLELMHGRVVRSERVPGGFAVTVKKRGASEPDIIRTGLAFDCTGHRADLTSPLIKSLLASGAASADPHGLGLVTSADGQSVGARGAVTEGLFALGPLCQGTLWEITAVPEIVAQATGAAKTCACILMSHAERSGKVARVASR